MKLLRTFLLFITLLTVLPTIAMNKDTLNTIASYKKSRICGGIFLSSLGAYQSCKGLITIAEWCGDYLHNIVLPYPHSSRTRSSFISETDNERETTKQVFYEKIKSEAPTAFFNLTFGLAEIYLGIKIINYK